jgi:hypothetical protein
VRDIRAAILDSLQQSDNGKAFKAALEGRGSSWRTGIAAIASLSSIPRAASTRSTRS